MRSWTARAAAAALVFSTVPASADWQYTQWGMSPAQVAAASNGVARQNDDRKLDAEDLKAEMTAPYQGGALPFTAVFLFDAKEQLKYVTLNPVGHVSCAVIRTVLAAHHGAPVGKVDLDRATTMHWDDIENDDLVVYLDLGEGNCSIQYSKLPNTRPTGDSL